MCLDICVKPLNGNINLKPHSTSPGDIDLTSINIKKNNHVIEVSNKQLTQKSKLKSYSLGGTDSTYKNKKIHVCNVCNKGFSHWYTLRDHLLVHTGEKHVCDSDVCSKEFARKSSLKEHAIIHEEVKPHVCQVCGRQFNRKRNMEKHLLRAHTK
ncbi:hypothetical protein JTE90_004630 [Oedothorax gibbosus]|uniref:C2H2-type domain-containing protein n=1 Tax=Oedothorax gibbosus TaxID=931172 RepID=A0AAV6USJ3_9ARAC|nr:hypothetical protein JTE90_004630 [Oedothorax gibbosus]